VAKPLDNLFRARAVLKPSIGDVDDLIGDLEAEGLVLVVARGVIRGLTGHCLMSPPAGFLGAALAHVYHIFPGREKRAVVPR
jgi:hypothetical protein